LHRILFHLGGLTIYSYGVMLAIGFIAATLVARRYFSQRDLDPEIVLYFAFVGIIGGVVGARLLYVIGHWSYYGAHPGEILKVNQSGLVFYGGLGLALALGLLVARWKKVRLWTALDLAGICVPLGLAITRIGCFLNGCSYGKTTTMPWGVTFPASTGLVGARHPTQIYELILDLGLFAFLWWKKDSFTREGTAFWIFVMGYGAIRFAMEFFRAHGSPEAGLAFQIFSIVMVVAGAVVLLLRNRLLPASIREAPDPPA
jgi:phosphatidylglycerol:prolipoprotein diacylglycerol transferase